MPVVSAQLCTLKPESLHSLFFLSISYVYKSNQIERFFTFDCNQQEIEKEKENKANEKKNQQRLKFHKCSELHNNGSNVPRNNRPTLLKTHTKELRFGVACASMCECLFAFCCDKSDNQEMFTRAK